MTSRRIYLSPPHMGDAERELLLDAFDSNWIAPLGPHVEALEREFAEVVQVPYCAALSSGTAGLHLALRVLGIGPGDVVLTTTLTFAASANAIRYVGAEPVFVDSEEGSWNMDPALLAEELERRGASGTLPKAVLVVDAFGQCADYDPILEACRRFEVPVIEDAAESLGATYAGKPAGSFGDLAVFSFNGNKIITASGGGMLVSNRREWIEKAIYLATQARDPAPHYEHSTVGYNYRLSNLLAAVARGQLQVLTDRVAARRANNRFYRRALADKPGVSFMPEIPNGCSTFWLTCMTVDPAKTGTSPADLRNRLESQNIECRPVWKPMHLQPVFSEFESVGGHVAERLFRNGLCLPSGSNLNERELARIASLIEACLQSPARSNPSNRA